MGSEFRIGGVVKMYQYRRERLCRLLQQRLGSSSAVESRMLFSTGRVASAEAEKSMVAGSGGSSGGFLSGLFGGSSRLTVPLTEPLPGVQVTHNEPPMTAPTTEMTTLSNGFKVASENTPVRVLVDCG